jgi:hypothetical protein
LRSEDEDASGTERDVVSVGGVSGWAVGRASARAAGDTTGVMAGRVVVVVEGPPAENIAAVAENAAVVANGLVAGMAMVTLIRVAADGRGWLTGRMAAAAAALLSAAVLRQNCTALRIQPTLAGEFVAGGCTSSRSA